MLRFNPSPKERALADRLRREAVDGRPEYSQRLHRQLCSAVRSCESAKTAAGPASAVSLPRRYALVTAIAVAGAIAAVVFVQQTWMGEDGPRPAENASLAASSVPAGSLPRPTAEGMQVAADVPSEMETVGELADFATDEIGTMVEWTVTQRPWDYLDENARAAFEALNRHVPLDAAASLMLASTDP